MHFDMDLGDAIRAPRVHLEGERLAIEHPEARWPDAVSSWLDGRPESIRRWPQPSLYFGGVHAVADDDAAADPRRGGCARSLEAR